MKNILGRLLLLIISLTVLTFLISSCSSNGNDDPPEPESIDIVDELKESGLINKSEAIAIAKGYDNNTAISWEALFENDKEIQLNNEINNFDVWTVTATYPFGNKMIVEIDATNGEILVLTEVEAE